MWVNNMYININIYYWRESKTLQVVWGHLGQRRCFNKYHEIFFLVAGSIKLRERKLKLMEIK